ncbi:MAG: hypothetical protein V7735_00670 [Photobacterium frigidiphilum]
MAKSPSACLAKEFNNVTLIHLPPYSPELNSIDNLINGITPRVTVITHGSNCSKIRSDTA